MLTAVFSLFYFMINVGSLMSTIITPLLREYTSYTIAFGVPAILLMVATAIFWFGSSTYIKVCKNKLKVRRLKLTSLPSPLCVSPSVSSLHSSLLLFPSFQVPPGGSVVNSLFAVIGVAISPTHA